MNKTLITITRHGVSHNDVPDDDTLHSLMQDVDLTFDEAVIVEHEGTISDVYIPHGYQPGVASWATPTGRGRRDGNTLPFE